MGDSVLSRIVEVQGMFSQSRFIYREIGDPQFKSPSKWVTELVFAALIL